MHHRTDYTRTNTRSIGVLLVGVLLAVLTGCSTTPKRDDLMARLVENPELTSIQLRIRVFQLARLFADDVERAADQIAAGTDDPEVRRNTLLWKTNAIGACLGGASRLDAFAALLHVQVLTMQMTRFFEEGAGSKLFGDAQGIAVETARSLEEKAHALAYSVYRPEDLSGTGTTIEEFVEENPLQDLYFATYSGKGAIFALMSKQEKDVMASVATMKERFSQVVLALPLYSEVIPKQARWQAELLLDGLMTQGQVLDATQDMGAMAASVGRIQTVLEDTPNIIGKERAAAIDAMHTTLGTVLNEQRESLVEALVLHVDKQREAVEQLADRERTVVTKELQRQRLDTIRTLQEERKVVLQAVHQERVEALDEIKAMVKQSVEVMPGYATAAVDHFWWRATQFAAVLVALLLLAAFGVTWYARRAPSTYSAVSPES